MKLKNTLNHLKVRAKSSHRSQSWQGSMTTTGIRSLMHWFEPSKTLSLMKMAGRKISVFISPLWALKGRCQPSFKIPRQLSGICVPKIRNCLIVCCSQIIQHTVWETSTSDIPSSRTLKNGLNYGAIKAVMTKVTSFVHQRLSMQMHVLPNPTTHLPIARVIMCMNSFAMDWVWH